MNVSLSRDVQQFVEDKVKSGQYASLEEAVNGLLLLAREQEHLKPEDVAELRAEIDKGVQDADAGRFAEFTAEDIIAEGRAALAARQKGA